MMQNHANMLNTDEHEKTIIASVARRPSALAEVCAVLREEHFGSRHLAEVWRLMRDAAALDARALNALLPPDSLRALGGPAGVAELLALAPAPDLTPYVEAVLAAHERRQMHRALGAAMRALEAGADASDALRDVMQSVAAQPARACYTADDAESLLDEYIESVGDKRATGFNIGAIDAPIGGLRPGRLHVVAA
ncbi:MAG: DnaB-like helicase N-terminal domain-containing protein, partial [Thermoflexales bacterium]